MTWYGLPRAVHDRVRSGAVTRDDGDDSSDGEEQQAVERLGRRQATRPRGRNGLG